MGVPSPKLREEREKELDNLVKKWVKEIEKRLDSISQRFGRIRQQRSKGTFDEIYDDWCTVRGFAEGVKESIISSKEEATETKKRRYAVVQAYLKLARYEKDLGLAWKYVNSADKLLPLLVDYDDLDRSLLRMRTWDKWLPKDLHEKLKEKDKETREWYRVVDISTKNKHIGKSSSARYRQERRIMEYERQAVRSQLWNSFNTRITLRIDVWSLLRNKLLVGLLPAILIAEVVFVGLTPEKPWWYFPFLYVSGLGCLGGMLSVVVYARKYVVENPYRVEIRAQIFLRVIIGAAGAFVVHAIFGSGLIVGDLPLLLRENVYVFVTIGIVAGFSEQLFVTSLNETAKNLHILRSTE